MESTEFDATLGGTEHLPYSANNLKFAASRSVEIAAMTESILRPSKTKLIFQSLPVHMRRRVMSHNCKRLPRKLRQAHLEQLKKSGLPPKQKRPSRKFRRRPANLLDEYNQRQKRNIWLETHIWHAKRFHMIERWGHRLPYAPCDKAFRACYRATSTHCLMQDISYFTHIQITGQVESIQNLFKTITSVSGLSISAKAYLTGNREGEIDLYGINSFPFGFIGKVRFIWVPCNNTNRTLWLFVHPSQRQQVESVLTDLLNSDRKNYNCETSEKRRKISNKLLESVEIKLQQGRFNRFRLTGPNSHAILIHSLKCIDDLEKIKSDDWVALHSKNNCELYLKEKNNYWKSLCSAYSPSQLPSKIVIGLIVRDPRLQRPAHRTKARYNDVEPINRQALLNLPSIASTSPLWDTALHEMIKKKAMNNGQFIEHVTKLQLVPGEIYKDDPALQSVPVVLIQRPGSQDSTFKKIGYGNGWDIIVPSGYGLPFWLTFTMFGARSGGLRETESLAFEMGECYFPPDSNAGKIEEKQIESDLREKYFRLPPSKRVNYIKLAVNSPFICHWNILLKDWNDKVVSDFFVLRDRKLLDNLQECVNKKSVLPQIRDAGSCLVAVYIKMEAKGSLQRHALICLPEPGDFSTLKTLCEPHHDDLNEKLRQNKRYEHMKNIKKVRRSRIKLKKHGSTILLLKSGKRDISEPSEYTKIMREMWLPSNITTVRHVGSRQILGYLVQGAFSFSEARGCGIGYIPFNALSYLLLRGQNKVLIRNTTSRKYRLAKIDVMKIV